MTDVWTRDGNLALEAHGVSVRVHEATVLHDVSLGVPRGRWTCVVGPNGAGKSTLLKALAGLVPHAGTITLLGRPLSVWPRQQRARTLVWMGQGEASADDLTVWDVAMLGRLPYQRWMQPPSAVDRSAVEHALRATGAWAWRSRALGQLSGGERQRVLLARALATQAAVLLMDEPLTHLDPPYQADWLALVRSLVAQGKTVVSVLHEINMALQADVLVIVAAGRVLHQGASSDAATHRALERVFEGCLQVLQLPQCRIAVPVRAGASTHAHHSTGA